jgi:hypothetical protein
MSSFVFITPQGAFPVPDGESRIGSDSSCAICVHGEGILPIHAYVKVDAGKLLLRPSSEKAAVMLDGAPVAGPQAVAKGQRVAIGPFELRLETQKRRRRFPVRWLLYAGGTVAGVAVVLVLLRYLWFNETWWKTKIVAAVESTLGRENAKVDRVEVDLFRGVLTFTNLRVPNQLPFPEDSSLLKVERVTVRLDPWVWLKSGFTEVRKGEVTFEGPELTIERVAAQDGRPVSNVDDLGARIAQSSTSWLHRLTALEAQGDVLNGRVIVKDAYAGVGESRLENVSVKLAQPGFGEPLTIRLEATPAVPEQPAAGSPQVTLGGQWRVFDAAGRIEGEQTGGGELSVRLEDFDLARLCRHLQWEWRRRGGAQRIVPGKPITGEFRILSPNLKAWEVRGTASSESLVSLYEGDGQPPIGNIPTVLKLNSLTYDAEKGRPTALELDLRGYRPVAGGGPRSLDDPKNRKDEVLFLHTEGKRLPSGDEDKFVVNLLFPRLADLCATDVGERLKLKGRLQGSLILNAQLIHDTRKGETRIEGDANLSEDAKVLVPGGEDPQAGRWQPLRLAASFDATASPNAKGEVAKVEARFKARSDSFEAESTVPAVVNSLDAWDRLSVFTKFKMRLMGREFWTEFGPVLGLFGFERPIEEILSLEVRVVSDTVKEAGEDTRRIQVGLEGQAARQWKETRAPVDLDAILDYYPELFTRSAARPAGSGAPAPAPYLRLTLKTGSTQQWPYVEIRDAEWIRNGDWETVRAPKIEVNSDSAALQERFGPYLERLYGFLGVDFLREYSLAGSFGLKGSLSVTRRVGLAPPGAPPSETEFRFLIAGQNMELSGPVLAAGAGPDGAAKRWTWAETQPQLSLEGRYRYEPAANPEEPEVRRLDHLRLDMQGQIGNFKVATTDLDLFLLGKLAARARTPGKSWPDAAGALQVSGTFEPAGFDFLRRLELPGLKPWLHDPLVGGRLALNLDYDRREDRAKLKELVFKQAEVENAFWLKDLDLVAELRAVRALSRELFGRPAGEPLDIARLLDHLSGAGPANRRDVALVIRSLVFDAPGFVQWLARHPPLTGTDAPRETSFADFVPAWLTELLRAKRLDPQHGPWTMKDVAIWALEKPERSWGLSGDFQNDLYLTLPPEAALPPGRADSAPVLIFQGPWRLPERPAASLTLSQEGDIYAKLLAELDGADITLRGLLPEYVYRKPGNEPLRLELDGLLPLADRCAFSQLSLTGGPLELAITDLQAREKRAPGHPTELDSFTLASGTVRGGPLFQSCGFENLLYERETGKAGGQVRAVQFDLPALAKLLPPVAGLTYKGRLSEARLDARGDLAAFLALDPDPRRDRLQLSARADRLSVKIETAPDECLDALVSGSLSASLTRLDVQGLDLNLAQLVPGRKGAPPVGHQLLFAKGSLATLDPEQSLRQALRKEPLALHLELPAVFRTNLDLDALDAAAATLGKFWRKTQGLTRRPESANRFEWLSKLRVDGSLSVPAVRSGAWTLERLEVPKYSLREMKVTVPTTACAAPAAS